MVLLTIHLTLMVKGPGLVAYLVAHPMIRLRRILDRASDSSHYLSRFAIDLQQVQVLELALGLKEQDQ